MSFHEIQTRAIQEANKRVDLLRLRLGGLQPRGSAGVSYGKFFFDRDERDQICAVIKAGLPRQAANIVKQADQICEGKFDLLGYQALDYRSSAGPRIDWHRDAVSGKIAPRKPCFQVRYLEFDEVGDSKVTWELNRHQNLVVLAKAWCLSGEPRYAEQVVQLWGDWQAENPYLIGINWASSLEVAIRSLSWLWVAALLEGAPISEEFFAKLDGMLALSGRHIERYLSEYFAPNTHLLGEALGLFAIGTLRPGLPDAERWKNTGLRWLRNEAKRQVRADGHHVEQSTYYHVYALDMFLHARILAERNGIELGDLDPILQKMLGALSALSANGLPPRCGDDDGGRLFDAGRNLQPHMVDPLSTGAVRFRNATWKSAARDVCEETLWLLGAQALQSFAALPGEAPSRDGAVLADTGLYVQNDGTIRLVIDAGPHGFGAGGHGHADALSVTVSVDGRDLLVDAGTYTYVPGERDSFRGTAAHNTITVDGTDQAIPVSAFGWTSPPRVEVDRSVATTTFQYLSTHHDGYGRITQGLLHSRTVFQNGHELTAIRDLVSGTGVHSVDSHWHAAPGASIAIHEQRVEVFADDTRKLVMDIAAEGWTPALQPYWFSPVYGSRQQASELVLNRKAPLPAETMLILRDGRAARLAQFTRAAWSEGANASVYIYRDDATHVFIFADRNTSWSVNGVTSDARFAYMRVSTDGTERLCLVDVSRVCDADGDAFLADKPDSLEAGPAIRTRLAGWAESFLSDGAASGVLSGVSAASGRAR